MSTIDLNADVGEGATGAEAALLDLVSSVSVACGGHAGDERSMTAIVEAAMERSIRIGAHPSYPDAANFGRKSLAMSATELIETIIEQIGALRSVAEALGGEVRYFKPHGALYNDAAAIPSVAEVIIDVANVTGMPFMALANSLLTDLAEDAQLPYIKEGFVDRGYRHDRTLIPRGQDGDIITSVEDAVGQAFLLREGVDSLCVHSDSPDAVTLLSAVRDAFENAGWQISAEPRMPAPNLD